MTGFALKIIAMLSMLTDHLGYLVFPDALWLRAVGRLAFPLFAFMTAEGARLTHNRRRYLVRLLCCGVLSEIPFDLLGSGVVFDPAIQNVCFTLAAGVCCVWLLERGDGWSVAGVLTLMLLAFVLNTDYSFVGVFAVVIIHRFSAAGKPLKGGAAACLALSLSFGGVQFLCFLSLIPLRFYNGRPGPRCKYLFYAFYPLHMLILWAVWILLRQPPM